MLDKWASARTDADFLKTMTLNSALNMLRIVGIVFTVLAALTFYLWTTQQQTIDLIGVEAAEYYLSYYRNRAIDARKMLGKKHEQGISQLHNLLIDLEPIKKGDRLAPLKIRIFGHLIQALETNKDVHKALGVAEQWVLFDDRDLFAQVIVARLKLKTPETRQAGGRLFQHVIERVPDIFQYSEIRGHSEIIELYSQYLFEEGELAECFLFLRKNILDYLVLRNLTWKVNLNVGNGFRYSESTEITPNITKDGRLQLSFPAPVSVRAIRIYPPSSYRLNIQNPLLILSMRTDKKSIKLWNHPLRLIKMHQEENVIHTSGERRPSFSWKTKTDTQDLVEAYDFVANVKINIPDIAHQLVSQPYAKRIEAKLRSLGNETDIIAFQQLRHSLAQN